jgi:hypothetical protein
VHLEADDMRVRLTCGLACGLLALAPALIAQRSTSCDRACLDGWVDRYVDALVAHAPGRLALSGTAKFTENGQRLEPGDGAWHTVTGRGGYSLHLADVEAGQAVLMGTIREAETPTIFVLRLHIVNQAIADIETLVIRNQAAAENLDRIARPRQVLSEAVPAGERMSRSELVRTANMYFSGIELNDGKGVYPIAETCARLENGSVTAGDPALVLGEAAAAAVPKGARSSCLQQFQSGMFHYVTRIRDRRFVLVDSERGLAFAFAFFDNAAGDARNVTLADGRRVVSGSSVPWTWQIAEVFKIERGRIGPVESVLHPVPYGMGSGWSTWEEAMSSTPRW